VLRHSASASVISFTSLFNASHRKDIPLKTAAQTLAEFVATLQFEALPQAVLNRAKECIAHAVGCGIYGSRFPWSEKTFAYAQRYGQGGPCTTFADNAPRVHAPAAAFANGCAVHAFEQDSLRFPGAGVHPGATLVPTVIAACEETGANGKTALLAFVAGCEVLFRVGAAAHQTSEKLGFHAPGLTGPYGAAAAASVVYGLDTKQTSHALGIAGSLSAGLLAFVKSEEGAMVKRMHMGRACEAGIVAARLAADGYTGPETILEGRFGFLQTYAIDGYPAALTAGLRTDWETLRICTKRYACHVTAQTPVQIVRDLIREHEFAGSDVASLALFCNEKVISHHDIRTPQDVMQAQYSVPFCVALALFRNPEDPRVFDESALTDPSIIAACTAIELVPQGGADAAWGSNRVIVKLKDGRTLEGSANQFKGMPQFPASDEEQRGRFSLMTRDLGEERSAALFERLATLELQTTFPMH
jgi:2-methylcitrate dehydratase PrpD